MTGGGFTPNSIFTVTYLGFVLFTGTTTELGSVSANFLVPFTAQRGRSYAVFVNDEEGLSARFDHLVPKAAITLSLSEAFASETISITGTGFPPNVPPTSVTFSSFPSVQLTAGSPLPTTDATGDISIDVQVPWPSRQGVVTVDIRSIEATAPLTIRRPSISATPQGSNTILVVGEGFPPSSQASFSVDITVKIGPTVFSDEDGNISFQIKTVNDATIEKGIVHVSVGEFTDSAPIN